MIRSSDCPIASAAEWPNMTSAARFQKTITPARSDTITASGISSTIRWNSQGEGTVIARNPLSGTAEAPRWPPTDFGSARLVVRPTTSANLRFLRERRILLSLHDHLPDQTPSGALRPIAIGLLPALGRPQQFPERVRKDAAVAKVLPLPRGLDPHSNDESNWFALIYHSRDGYLSRLAAGDSRDGERLTPGEPE